LQNFEQLLSNFAHDLGDIKVDVATIKGLLVGLNGGGGGLVDTMKGIQKQLNIYKVVGLTFGGASVIMALTAFAVAVLRGGLIVP